MDTLRRRSVVQPWVEVRCTWKMQTVLFCALRGTDAAGSAEMKSITRWIRRAVLLNAAPDKTFMQREQLPNISFMAASDPLLLDMMPVHAFGHVMHAMEVIAYTSPTEEVSAAAWNMYWSMCDFLHVCPESKKEFHDRLADEVSDLTS